MHDKMVKDGSTATKKFSCEHSISEKDKQFSLQRTSLSNETKTTTFKCNVEIDNLKLIMITL